MNTQTITLDVSKRPSVVPVLYLRQGDRSGTTLRVEMYDNGSALPLSGRTVMFRMRAPKDRGYYEKSGGVSGNVATFVIDETYAATYPGITDTAYVDVIEGSSVIASTGSFRVVVLEDATEGVDPNTAYTNGIAEWLEDATETLNDAASRAEAAIEAIGDISELAVPLMSADTRGGAKLGHGLRIAAGEKLAVQLVDGATGEGGVEADGDYLHALAVEGLSVQDGTPTPENPIEVQTVKGINLVDFAHPQVVNTDGGVTFTINDDGSYGVSGTATKNTYIYVTNNSTGLQLPAGVYTFTARDADGNYVSDVRLGASKWVDGVNTSYGSSPTTSSVMTFTHSGEGNVQLLVYVLSGHTANTTVYPQLEIGTEAHDYVPYDSLGLKVTGKNRLDMGGYTDRLHYGVQFTNASGGVTVKGTATDNAFNITGLVQAGLSELEAGTYTLSWDDPDNIGFSVSLRDGGSNVLLTYGASGRSFTVGTKTSVYIIFYVPKGKTVDCVFKPMIAKSGESAEYVPFLDTVTAIPLNGNVLASLPDGTHDELRVDDAGHVVLNKQVKMLENLGSIITGYDATSLRFYSISITDFAAPTNTTTQIRALCTHVAASTYSNISASSGQNNVMGAFASGGTKYFAVKATAYADRSSLQAALADAILYYATTDPQTIDLGYIDMPKLSDGSAIELLATIDPPMGAEWWAVGAGAVHESNAAWYGRVSSELAAISEAIADL